MPSLLLDAEDLTAADECAAIADAVAVFLDEDAREEEVLMDADAKGDDAEAPVTATVTRQLRNSTCSVQRMPMTASPVPLRRIMGFCERISLRL
jgi:hypothetical protein